MRCAPTLLSILLAAMTLAPLPGRIEVLRIFASDEAPATYAALAALPTGEMTTRLAVVVGKLLGVPSPAHLILHSYPSRPAFARGLVDHLRVNPALAAELADTAIGLARPGMVFLLADGRDDDRVRLVIHELTHLVQHDLAGPAARPPQWLMEGTAEWAALTLLRRLGADGATARATAARAAAKLYLAMDPGFMPANVRRSIDFRRWQRQVGDLVAYRVAYGLAHHLVTRHGVGAIVRYFRAFRTTHDAERNFQEVFGISTAGFSTAARDAMEPSVATQPSPPPQS